MKHWAPWPNDEGARARLSEWLTRTYGIFPIRYVKLHADDIPCHLTAERSPIPVARIVRR